MNILIDALSASMNLSDLLKHALMLLALCTVRVYAAFLVIPATSDQALQGVVRNGLCLTLGTFVAFGQPLDLVRTLPLGGLVLLMAKEALLGLLLGYAAATVFWVAEGAGMLIDTQAGFNSVQQSNPLSGEQSTPVGNMMSQLAIAGFYMLGGMLVLTGVLFESFAWWPLQVAAPDWSNLLETFVHLQVGRYIEGVAKLAAPILLMLVLIDLGFGFIGKTAEKLEPHSLAQPVKAAVAMAMLSLLVALFFEQAKPALSMRDLGKDIRLWLHAAPSVP